MNRIARVRDVLEKRLDQIQRDQALRAKLLEALEITIRMTTGTFTSKDSDSRRKNDS